MFVILEWNQTANSPRLANQALYHDAGDAQDDAEWLASRGRSGERYTVHQLNSDGEKR